LGLERDAVLPDGTNSSARISLEVGIHAENLQAATHVHSLTPVPSSKRGEKQVRSAPPEDSSAFSTRPVRSTAVVWPELPSNGGATDIASYVMAFVLRRTAHTCWRVVTVRRRR